jgi:hypothetical protein
LVSILPPFEKDHYGNHVPIQEKKVVSFKVWEKKWKEKLM